MKAVKTFGKKVGGKVVRKASKVLNKGKNLVNKKLLPRTKKAINTAKKGIKKIKLFSKQKQYTAALSKKSKRIVHKAGRWSPKLSNGKKMKVSDALDLASDFLGKGYTEPVHGSGRFVSADGRRVFRMGVNDILGKHGGGPHVNFELLAPNPAKHGKMKVIKNSRIFLSRTS